MLYSTIAIIQTSRVMVPIICFYLARRQLATIVNTVLNTGEFVSITNTIVNIEKTNPEF